MKKTILGIQIINVIFFFFIYGIAVFQNTMKIDYSLIPFYMLSIFGFSLVMGIIIVVVLLKNKIKEKIQNKYGLIVILNFIGLLLLLFSVLMLDNRNDKINFSKNAVKTTARITYVEKKEKKEYKSELEYRASHHDYDYVRKPYYTLEYIYHFSYFVENKEYTSTYKTSKTDTSVSVYQQNPKYNNGEIITIYYNKENPDDIRMYINYYDNTTFIIMAIINILFQIFCFYMCLKFIKKNSTKN